MFNCDVPSQLNQKSTVKSALPNAQSDVPVVIRRSLLSIVATELPVPNLLSAVVTVRPRSVAVWVAPPAD